MRLIDADSLLERENANPFFVIGTRNGKSLFGACKTYLQMTVEAAPTIDAVPVVHGRWVDKLVRDWHCSECEKKVPRQVYFDGYCYADKLNYCPNCGAKMDG